MNILLLGSGGRENALAWKIKQSTKVENLYVAPGNAGTQFIARNIEISINDFPAIKKFVLENKIDMVVVGPEEPLVKGIYDYFVNDTDVNHIPVIGPSKEARNWKGARTLPSSL